MARRTQRWAEPTPTQATVPSSVLLASLLTTILRRRATGGATLGLACLTWGEAPAGKGTAPEAIFGGLCCTGDARSSTAIVSAATSALRVWTGVLLDGCRGDGVRLRNALIGEAEEERDRAFFLTLRDARFFGLTLLLVVLALCLCVRRGVGPAEGTMAKRVCCRLDVGVDVEEPGRLRVRLRFARDCAIYNCQGAVSNGLRRTKEQGVRTSW
jgi:hypothetical protein